MAYQTAGLEVQDKNPYNLTVTNGSPPGTAAVEIAYDQSKVTTRNDLIVALEMAVEYLQNGASMTNFGPNHGWGPPT